MRDESSTATNRTADLALIARMRLRNTRLAGTPFPRIEDAVRTLVAVQAQDYPGAMWGLEQRLRTGSRASIEQAYNAGRILRTHIMRPTWHFVTPEDLRWLQSLTAPRVRQFMAGYDRKLELDAAVLERSKSAIAKALGHGVHLTRTDLVKVLASVRIEASGQRLYHIIMHAELDALICSGAMRGKQHTYALADTRSPPGETLPRDDALAKLARRYLESHGPAQARDFAWWAGLTIKDAQRGFDANAGDLERAECEGAAYWYSRSRARLPAIADPSVMLLPNYDEYLIGYRDHAASFGRTTPPLPHSALFDMFLRHIVVLNGHVAGGWRILPPKHGAGMEVRLIGRMTHQQQSALRAAASRYAEFVGVDKPTITFV